MFQIFPYSECVVSGGADDQVSFCSLKSKNTRKDTKCLSKHCQCEFSNISSRFVIKHQAMQLKSSEYLKNVEKHDVCLRVLVSTTVIIGSSGATKHFILLFFHICSSTPQDL